MYTSFLADPNWERLGFEMPPDQTNAGKGIGIVITDTAIHHPLIQHLAGRLKRVTVSEDLSVNCVDIILEEPQESSPYPSYAEHGMMSLFLLSHLPFEVNGKKYVGLVPNATFIMIDSHDPVQLKKGMEWIMERREEWNIKIVINLQIIGGDPSIRPTCDEPLVQAMKPALYSGVLVIQANGNSPAINSNSPIDFFAIGGSDDHGQANNMKKPYPQATIGMNGDGHFRPDILAPFTYLPAPYYHARETDLYTPYYNPAVSNVKVSYFGGTCGSATLIGGVCAYILAKYPKLTVDELRAALIHFGTPLGNNQQLLPMVNVAKTLHAIETEQLIPSVPSSLKKSLRHESLIKELKRGIELTKLIEQKSISREELWKFVDDPSPYVQKVAIWGLHKPSDNRERALAWKYFYNLKDDRLGVREAWSYMLLFGAIKEELNQWMRVVTDSSTDVRHCVKHFLAQYYPEAPSLEHTPDTNKEVIQMIADPVLRWYKSLII